MLMGEQSMLPIYQTVFSGSLKDISTLTATLAGFDSVTSGKPVLAVMDKGFFSKRNTDAMLTREGMRFIASVPFTSALAKKQVESERKDIDTADKTDLISKVGQRHGGRGKRFGVPFCGQRADDERGGQRDERGDEHQSAAAPL
jgi:transposase